MINILTIIKSRFNKEPETEETKRRRSACKICEFNSKNVKRISLIKKILIKLSDFYSWITGNKNEDNLHNCGVCGCSIYYKSAEKEEKCPKNKW